MNEKVRTVVSETLLDLGDIHLNRMERRGLLAMVEDEFNVNPALTDQELSTITKNSVAAFQTADNKHLEQQARNHFGAPITIEELNNRIKELSSKLSSGSKEEQVQSDMELAKLMKNNYDLLS